MGELRFSYKLFGAKMCEFKTTELDINKKEERKTNMSAISADCAARPDRAKILVRSARLSTARSVNHDDDLLYWGVGCGIVEKQEKYRYRSKQ